MKQRYITGEGKGRNYTLRVLFAVMLVSLFCAKVFAAPPTITQQPTNSTVCAGGTTSFTVVATGATGYQWEVNQGSGFAPVSGAVYSGANTPTLTITGATASMNGYQYHCVVNGTPPPTPPQTRTTNDVTLTVNSPPAITTQPQNRTVCAGSGTTFTAAASNATGYQWQVDQGAGFANASGPPYSGVTTPTLTISSTTASMNGYQYRLIASGSCPPNATSNAGTLTVITISTTGSQTNVSCNGGSNGSATVTPSGGVTPYTYSWAPSGGTNATATGRTAGNYTVTVTDATGCTATRTYTITEPSAITSTGSQTNVSCNGGSNGSATVTPSGGTPGYTYSWAPSGGTDSTATGLSAGNYTVTITDANGCTATRTYTITEPSAITSTGSQTNVSCNGGSNGSATVTPSGGTPGYTYSWAPSGGTNSTATGLAAGSYTVTITDANGCTATRTYTITQPPAITSTGSQTNVSCNGGNNGSATVTPSGGTPGYIYSWAPSGGTDSTATGLSAGNYTVTITDANSCTATRTYTITEPSMLTATVSQTDISCNGGNDGTATVTPSGGTPGYTYSWAPSGGTNSTAAGLAAGSYTVTITDANSCTATRTYTITQPLAITSTGSQTNVSCNEGSNGSATVTPSGGTPGYTYSWVPSGGTDSTATNLPAGNYTVTITDANGCTATRTYIVTEPSVLSATGSQTDVSCNGGNDGTATVTPSGGTAPYTYLWNPAGGTDSTATGLAAGGYTVTVTDSNGCTVQENYTITEPDSLLLSASVTNVGCNSDSTGAIDITVSGGTTPYTYIWSTGETTEDVSGLPAGTYSVTVSDSHACSITATMSVTEPAVLSISGTVTDAGCNSDSTGAIDITMSGGTTPYSFSWSNGETTEDVSGLAAGSYTVTVHDAHQCQVTSTFTVNEPAVLALSTTVKNASCNGDSTGMIDLTVSGGTAPYTYIWNNSATSEDITALAAGTYSVLVTDDHYCILTATVTITEPAALGLASVTTNVGCNGDSTGAVDITITGGTTPYAFAWSNGGTSEDISGLTAGSYNITVTDSNSCMISGTITVTEPSVLGLTSSVTNVGCNGDSTGAVDITVSGGTTPYSFTWSNGETGEDASGLVAGTYTVTVYDAHQCSITSTVSITEPSALGLSSVTTNVGCNGDSTGVIDVTVTGGTTPYSFAWSNGETTEDISGLIAGSYNITVTDSNSCMISGTITVTEPVVLGLTSSVTNVGCNGDSTGAIDITVAGGTAPYSFSWSNGETSEDISGLTAGTYTVTVYDAHQCSITSTVSVTEPNVLGLSPLITNVGCNGDSTGGIYLTVSGGTTPYTFAWSNGETGDDVDGLTAGTYTVTVYDAHQCSITSSLSVTGPNALGLISSLTNAGCNSSSTGAIDITVSGGTAPYTFSWNNGETGEDVSGLAAGSYNVTVTDSNSCMISGTFTITEPGVLDLASEIQNVRCHGDSTGFINLTISGGTTPYTFAWSNGETTEDVFDLPAGTYLVNVTDSNGCSVVDTLDITEPALFTLSTIVNNVGCNGDATGSIDNTLGGGTPPVTFSWNTGDTSEDLIGIPAGTYSVIIIDSNSCTIMDTVTITEPNTLMVSSSITNAGCNGDSSGAINITVTGGTMPYSYIWSNGETTEDISGLAPGTYTVTVYDDHQCSITSTITVTGSSALTLSSSVTNIGCGGGTGAIDITVSGGTMPYTFNWSNGSTMEDISGLTTGSYSITVTDSNSCIISGTMTITQLPLLSLTSVITDVSCGDDSSGAIDITVTGGTMPYLFAWSNGATTEDAGNLPAGSYAVTVTDSNLCSIVDTFTINGYSPMAINVTVSNVSCMDTTAVIDVTVTGGAGGLDFTWNNGSTSEDLTNIGPGTYIINVTDTNGCSIGDTIVVIGDPVLSYVVTFDVPMDTICYRHSVVPLTASPEGGIFSGNGVQGNIFDPNSSFGEHVITYTYIDSGACGIDTVVVTDTVWVVLCSGIDPVAFDNSIHIVPNPSDGQFMLSLEGLGDKDVTVRIMDAGGRLVFSESLQVSNGTASKMYDTSMYSKGLYMVQVVAGDRVLNQRLIVQ